LWGRAGRIDSAQSAQKHVADYALGFVGEGWQEVAPQNIVGDATRAFIKNKGVFTEYMLVFSYRNCIHQLTAYGLQAEVNPAFMEMIAFNLLRKIQAAPVLP
jgi:hypothetical protein